MTIATTTSKTIVQGNGATTTFNYNFLMSSASYAQVILTEVDGTQTDLTDSQYQITGVSSQTGGTVIYPLVGGPISSGSSLTIMRVLPLRQGISIENQGPFYPHSIDQANDQSRMIDQQLQEQIDRSLIVAPGDPPVTPIPSVAQRAGQILGFDSEGNPIAAQPSSALVSSAMQPVVAAATREEAFALLKPPLARYVYAMDFGVLADGLTDDTGAWNDAIAYANANPYTTIISPPGTSLISALDPFTSDGCAIMGWGSEVNSFINHSGDEAFTWESDANYGGMYNIGINNVGPATNISIRLGLCQFLTFDQLHIGQGVGTFCRAGITAVLPAVGAATQIRFSNLVGTPVDVGVPLFEIYNGNNFHITDCMFNNSANPGAITSGRNLINATIVAPAAWDTVILENVDTFCWDYALSATVSGNTAVGPILVQNCVLDSCQSAVFNFNIATPGYLKEATVQNNYMSCTNGVAMGISGNGEIRALTFQNNRIRIAGTSGITCTVTGIVEDLLITGNDMYDLNSLVTSGTRGIQIACTVNYNNIQITNNLVASENSSFVTSTHLPEYGILVSGAPRNLNVQGNQARGSLANYLITSSATSSMFVNNIGQTMLPVNVSLTGSPLTFTTVNRQSTVFFNGNTISSISVGAVAGALANGNVAFAVPPNTTITVAYTSTPAISILYW